VILNAWCLVICLLGTVLMDRWGRKPTALLSTGLMTGFLIVLGVLSALYGESDYKPGIYGGVAALFLFQGSYSIGWTPLLYAYPPEVLHYPIRASGMGIFQLALNSSM
jgi:MFS family permease